MSVRLRQTRDPDRSSPRIDYTGVSPLQIWLCVTQQLCYEYQSKITLTGPGPNIDPGLSNGVLPLAVQGSNEMEMRGVIRSISYQPPSPLSTPLHQTSRPRPGEAGLINHSSLL